MNIFVCLKQTPARDSVIRPAGDEKWIDESDLTYEMNEPDAFALEEGLRLKEKHGGEVVAVSAGPERAGSAIREALAKGADRGILVEDEGFAHADTLAAAKALAAVLATESPDICNRTTRVSGKRVSSWPSCSICRTPPSSWRSTPPTTASK